MTTGMSSAYLSDCVTAVFNSREPLVRRRPAGGGADIAAIDLRGSPIASVQIRPVTGGSAARFFSNRVQGYFYAHLFRQCLPVNALPASTVFP